MKPPAFVKRKKNMTLEKLLIFGFSLAVLAAIATVGTTLMSDREQQKGTYDSNIDGIKGF